MRWAHYIIHRIVPGITCLAMGSVTTVLVAWTCSHFSIPAREWRAIPPDDRWSVEVGSGFGSTAVYTHDDPFTITNVVGDGPAPVWCVVRSKVVIAGQWPEWPSMSIYERASGWPLRAMHTYSVLASNDDGNRLFEFGEWEIGGVSLPLRVLWLGFTANTTLATAVYLALYLGTRSLQRTLRRRRGLCGRCGYRVDYSTQAACPECGTTFRTTIHPPIPRAKTAPVSH